MKRSLYLLLAAMMVLAVSCKKGPKVGTPSVNTLAATEIGPESARLNAKIDFAGVTWASVNFGFFWGTTEDAEGTYTMGEGFLDETNTYSAAIMGLTPETEYWFKAFVEIDGKSYSGGIQNFMTGVIRIPDDVVDLGMVLSRGDGTTYTLYWAKSNLCETGLCANPEDYGDYYAWGETETKSSYTWITYKWCDDGYESRLNKYCTVSSYGNVDNITELQRGENEGETVDDVARAKLHGKWRMPTDAEWRELISRCSKSWTTQNGIYGRLLTAPNGNSIFLPAAGYWYDTSFSDAGSSGYYWSSSLNTMNPSYACIVLLSSDNISRSGCSRFPGFSIRPVWEE